MPESALLSPAGNCVNSRLSVSGRTLAPGVRKSQTAASALRLRSIWLSKAAETACTNLGSRVVGPPSLFSSGRAGVFYVHSPSLRKGRAQRGEGPSPTQRVHLSRWSLPARSSRPSQWEGEFLADLAAVARFDCPATLDLHQ